MKHTSRSSLSTNSVAPDSTPRPDAVARQGVAKLAAFVVAQGLTAGAVMGQSVAPAPATPSSDDAVHLPEMVIEDQGAPALSSPKFTAPLIDTPQTISVIPQSVFNQQGATNLTEVLRNTPGISFNAGENGFSAGAGNFSMRGFDASDSILIDGARDQGNYLRDTFNVEQVEVAKGPSADNGRGSAGGYVNMVTKTPQARSFIGGTASYGFDEQGGTDASHRATLDVNQALTDHTAVRLNLLAQDGGVAGRDVAEKNIWGVAPSLGMGLGTSTRLFLSYQHVQQNDIPDYGVPSAFVDGFEPSGTTLRNDQLPSGVDRSNFYGLSSDYDDVTSDSFLARIEHDFTPDLTLSNQTRYSVTDREAIYTVVSNYTAPATVATARQAFDRHNTAISNLTNLVADFDTGSVQHTLATGLEVSREKSDSGRDFAGLGLGGGANTPVVNPDADRTPGAELAPANHDQVKVDSVGVYLHDTLKFSPKWQATAGMRVEHSKVSIRSSDGVVPDYDREDTALSGKLGIVFKPVKQGSIYAAAGVATLSPGAVFLSNPDISRGGTQSLPNLAGQQSEDSRLQKSFNYEIGTKWSFFDERLSTSLALFRTEKHDIGMSDGTAFLGYGKQYVQGIELSAVGAITEGWSVFGGIVFMDSKRSHSAAIDAALADGPTDGDELAFTPKVSANLWTTYRFPFGLTIGGGLQYVGESYVGRPDNVDRSIPNGFNGKVPDYIIFNGLLAYEVNENFTVRLNVENIADELYASNTNWSARRITLGAPRSYLLSLDVKF